MQVVSLTRKFTYNSIELADPNPVLTPEQVKEIYQPDYPELLNSLIEGPVTKNGVAVYRFTRAVGAKGAAQRRCAADILRAVLAPPGAETLDALTAQATGGDFAAPATRIANVVQSKSRSRALPIPAAAFGHWG